MCNINLGLQGWLKLKHGSLSRLNPTLSVLSLTSPLSLCALKNLQEWQATARRLFTAGRVDISKITG